MDAQTLNCPMCGAAASSDASKCEHCGARLATVACPSCFGLMFSGQKYCPHCGALAVQVAAESASLPCPKCKVAMNRVQLGKTSMTECPQCEGLWVDVASFKEICADREEQSVVLGAAALQPLPPINPDDMLNFHYVKCPQCAGIMNRVNFARCSGVIIDVCGQHGSWFDRDELRRIIEFIRNGGMSIAREREIESLKAERQLQRQDPIMMDPEVRRYSYGNDYDWAGLAVGAAAGLLKLFLRK
jgi:Zn-finger nucleic acid-binding protein